MSKYNCELCGKSFKQKIEYTRHKNKKTACVSVEKIKEIEHENIIINDNKAKLTSLFKYCLDVLRDNEHLVGDRALRSLAYILTFKLIEPKIGNEIDFDNYPYFKFDEFEDPKIMKEKLLFYSRFSNFAQREEIDLPLTTKYVWDTILSEHPKTKDIFIKDRGFEIKSQGTFKILITKINDFDFSNIDYDVQGEAYEEVIKDMMVGKIFGQFFTPPEIKKLMIKLINPQIKNDGTIETIYDPAMGTGGFLITALKHLLKQSKERNIPLNWDFIINNKGIGGREAEPNTFQLAKVNTLISSGHILMNIDCGDSIRKPIIDKYDIVLANPPYGIKGLNYDDINSPLRNEYLPIKINGAVPLFIQAIIYILNINGRAAVVLPDGQDLFSKNKSLVEVREYLMKTCDLKEIIYFPAGIFTHTSIKTCVAYFIKKKEGKDIIKTNVRHSTKSKVYKETERINKFTETHQTHKVEFYDYNPLNEVKTLLVEATIEQIKNNSYSLNYSEYIIDESKETEEEQIKMENNGITIKTLGEICKIENGYAFKTADYKKTKENNCIGLIQIKSIDNYEINSNKITEYVEENNKYTKYEINYDDMLISLTGYAGKIGKYKLPFKSYLNQRVCRIKLKTIGINPNYLYYWYISNDTEKIVFKMANGTAQPNISTTELGKIKIPIPPIEKQNEIVEKLGFIYEHCIKTSEEKIKQLKQLNKYYIESYIENYTKQIKTLGEICEFKNGKTLTKDKLINGVYPVIGGGQSPLGYHNTYNRQKNTILCSSSGAYAGFISIYNIEIWASDCFSIIPKNSNNMFIYYYLKNIQNNIYKMQTGAAQPHIYSKDLSKIKIPIPSIEKQNEIVQYCESNDNLIRQLEIEIEQNKKLAKEIINGILNSNNSNKDLLASFSFIYRIIYDLEYNKFHKIENSEKEIADKYNLDKLGLDINNLYNTYRKYMPDKFDDFKVLPLIDIPVEYENLYKKYHFNNCEVEIDESLESEFINKYGKIIDIDENKYDQFKKFVDDIN